MRPGLRRRVCAPHGQLGGESCRSRAGSDNRHGRASQSLRRTCRSLPDPGYTTHRAGDCILAVAAHHAGVIRTTLHDEGVQTPAVCEYVHKISDASDSLDGPSDDDQDTGTADVANLVPTDANAIAFSRIPARY